MNRKRLLLFVLLIVLALTVVWSYVNRPKLKTVASLKYAPGTRAVAEKKREPVVSIPSLAGSRTLRLDLLNRELPAFTGYRRNIFKPIFTDEVKVMKSRAAAVKPVVVPPIAPEPKKTTADAGPSVLLIPETPQQALAKFTFLGFISKDNDKTIFLVKEGDKTKDKNQEREILYVKKGDMFASRYEAIELTEQALTILVTDTGDEIEIPLIESQSLKGTVKAPEAKK